ncbi:unnamed protein product, partial [Coregonus sp. 'balchen']
MAESLSVVVLLLCGTLIPFVTAGGECEAYKDAYGQYKSKQDCSGFQWCCGTCDMRYCCSSLSLQLTESEQDSCKTVSGYVSTLTISSFVAAAVIIMIIFICCCVCPCCCLYK